MIEKTVYTVEQVPDIARFLIQQPVRIWTLQGSLGAGKTTLVQSMLRAWGVQGPIVSPTYSYVTIYRLADVTIYHFDLYRLTSADDFMQAGFDEYLQDPQGRVLIEWPEIMQGLLPLPLCVINIEYTAADQRLITWQVLQKQHQQ